MKKKTKVYTAYHFYLSLLFEYLLKDHGYDVEPLVKVGTLPLEVDIIIIKCHQRTEIKEFKQLDFLFNLLVDFNLIEFKGPTDTLEWQDYLHLTTMAGLYRIKIDHPANKDVRLFTIASTIPEEYREFLRVNGLRLDRKTDGLYAVSGTTAYVHYVLALNELGPDKKNELILFFSSKYHNKMGEIISFEENLMTLFLLQQLFQKERQKMKFKLKDEDLVTKDLEEAISQLPLELRLAGAKPEDLISAISKKDLKRLKELLDKLDLN